MKLIYGQAASVFELVLQLEPLSSTSSFLFCFPASLELHPLPPVPADRHLWCYVDLQWGISLSTLYLLHNPIGLGPAGSSRSQLIKSPCLHGDEHL